MNPITKIRDAREVALLALQAQEKQGAWTDALLKKMVQSLDARDAALATRLCFGVLQNQGLLDFYLEEFSSMPLGKMERLVLLNLRLGLYQILYMDKIPHNASVNTAVTLTKKHSKNPKAGGMVNGILRNIIRKLDALPEIPQDNLLQALSIEYSHPLPLVSLFSQEVPTEELALLLAANNSQPAITAMVNTVLASQEDVIMKLEGDGVEVTQHPWLSDCLILAQTGNIENLAAFREGLFYIQDPASRLAVESSGVLPGQRVLDTCAAPGGKSMGLGIKMQNQGEVISCDLHPHKKKLITASATRLHLDCITPETMNAKEFNQAWSESFDLVFVDAPCSGLGVIGKKPDIRYKDLDSLAELPEIQAEILENVSRYVKPGGSLLYSTCTILRRENEEILSKFLAKHPEFMLEQFSLPQPIGDVFAGFITLYPHKQGTDGFFIGKLRKTAVS